MAKKKLRRLNTEELKELVLEVTEKGFVLWDKNKKRWLFIGF